MILPFCIFFSLSKFHNFICISLKNLGFHVTFSKNNVSSFSHWNKYLALTFFISPEMLFRVYPKLEMCTHTHTNTKSDIQLQRWNGSWNKNPVQPPLRDKVAKRVGTSLVSWRKSWITFFSPLPRWLPDSLINQSTFKICAQSCTTEKQSLQDSFSLFFTIYYCFLQNLFTWMCNRHDIKMFPPSQERTSCSLATCNHQNQF